MKIGEVNVLEFGSVTLMALPIAIIGSAALTKKIKYIPTITNLILLFYFFNLTLII
jgi:hypothetical protein